MLDHAHTYHEQVISAPSLMTSYPTAWASFFLDSTNSTGVAKLCHDACGWGPFDSDFHITSCFIDGILYGALNAFLISFGTYQVYLLSTRHPLPSPLDWHFFTKLVSDISLYFCARSNVLGSRFCTNIALFHLCRPL